MPTEQPSTIEPRFFFLMPVWGESHVGYLLTYALPTLLAAGNLPSLPNRDVSQFTFITTIADEARIRASHLFSLLTSLVPIKFIHLDLYQGSRDQRMNQLGIALKLGAEEALGRGYCLFLHPDALYSNGSLKFLYGVAKSGKKACVSHGPTVSVEKFIPYLREHGRFRYDEVNPFSSRELAVLLMNNLHPDLTVHCMGNPHYPENPYMGFWLSPKNDGALFRFVSLHPYLVDVSGLSEIVEFHAIDHNFVRAHGFLWSEIHVEDDSDNLLVFGVKPHNESNAFRSEALNPAPEKCLVRTLLKPSNCNYSRYCFFNGIKVHFNEIDKDWRDFEVNNLNYVNQLISGYYYFLNEPRSAWIETTDLSQTSFFSRIQIKCVQSLGSLKTHPRLVRPVNAARRVRYATHWVKLRIEAFFRLVFKQPDLAFKKAFAALRAIITQDGDSPTPAPSSTIANITAQSSPSLPIGIANPENARRKSLWIDQERPLWTVFSYPPCLVCEPKNRRCALPEWPPIKP